jgi:MFS family permease
MRSATTTPALIAVALAVQSVVVLNSASASVALPALRRDLGLDLDTAQWVVTGYALALGAWLMIGGRLVDVAGVRAVLTSGMMTFAVSAGVAGLADSPAWVVAGRVVQGIGAGLASPAGLVLLTTWVPAEARARALAGWGATSGMAGTVGVLGAGLLADTVGWRPVFWLNAPVAAVIAAMGWVTVPRRIGTGHRRLDIPGALLVAAAAACVVAAVGSVTRIGLWALALAGVAAILVLLMIRMGRRSSDPIIPRSAGRTEVWAPNVLALLLGAALFGTFLVLSLHMQEVLDLSALTTGFGVLPVSASLVASTVLVPRLLQVAPAPVVLAGAFALVALGHAWLAVVGRQSGYGTGVLPAGVLLGAGIGTATVVVVVLATRSAIGGQEGLHSGLVTSAQQIGGALGLGLVATTAATVLGAAAEGSDAALAYAWAAVALATVGLMGVVLSLVLPGLRGPVTAASRSS